MCRLAPQIATQSHRQAVRHNSDSYRDQRQSQSIDTYDLREEELFVAHAFGVCAGRAAPVEAVTDSDRFRLSDRQLHRLLSFLVVFFRLLYLGLQVIYLKLAGLCCVSGPYLAGLHLVRDPMDRLFLRVEVIDAGLDLRLNEPRIGREERQLGGIEHLLLFTDLPCKLQKALPIQLYEPHVLPG